MDIGITAAVAFGSALLGAIAGFSGSLYLANRDAKNRRSGVFAALLNELMMNNDRSILVVGGGDRTGGYSSAIWDGTVIEVATFVDPDSFSALIQSYSLLETMDSAARRIEESANKGDESGLIRLGYETTRTAYHMLLAERHLPKTVERWQSMEPFEDALESLRAHLAKPGGQT